MLSYVWQLQQAGKGCRNDFGCCRAENRVAWLMAKAPNFVLIPHYISLGYSFYFLWQVCSRMIEKYFNFSLSYVACLTELPLKMHNGILCPNSNVYPEHPSCRFLPFISDIIPSLRWICKTNRRGTRHKPCWSTISMLAVTLCLAANIYPQLLHTNKWLANYERIHVKWFDEPGELRGICEMTLWLSDARVNAALLAVLMTAHFEWYNGRNLYIIEYIFPLS